MKPLPLDRECYTPGSYALRRPWRGLAPVAALFLFLCSGLFSSARAEGDRTIDYARLKRDLQSLLPALLREHRIAGVSMVVFSSESELSLSFGQADAAARIPITENTRFQAADLVRPVARLISASTFPKVCRSSRMSRWSNCCR